MADSDDLPPWAPGSADSGAGAPLAYAEPAPPRRSPAALVALLVGVLAVVGGAVFAVTQLAGDEGSPEGAVERLFDAFGNEDLLGVLEALPPSERDALRQPIEDLVGQLERLEVLSGDFDLRDLSGVDASFEGLRFESEPLREDLASVSLVGGTARTTTDPSALPLGDFVRDLAGEGLARARPGTETEDVAGDERIVAVKEGGRWYVSLWYSLAEAARDDAGRPLPDPDQRVEAQGADTPEGAVADLVRAAATFDLRRLIELLPPDEARALHDYAPLFLGEAERAAGELGRLLDVDISSLELAADEDGDHALVQVQSFEFDARVGEGTLRYRDGCATLSGVAGQEQRFCPSDFAEGVPGLLGPLAGADLPRLDVSRPELGFVAVRRDGAWYVSPTRTVLENLIAVLRVLDRQDLDQLAQLVRGFLPAGPVS